MNRFKQMFMVFESLTLPDKKDVPKPGLYKVAGVNSVIQAGGLALRDYISDKNEAGEQMVSDKVVRIPVGTVLNVEKFIHFMAWFLTSITITIKEKHSR